MTVLPQEEMQTQRREEAKEIMSQERLGDHGRLGHMGPSVGSTVSWINGGLELGWLFAEMSREFLGHFLEDEGYMHGISPMVFQVERRRKKCDHVL